MMSFFAPLFFFVSVCVCLSVFRTGCLTLSVWLHICLSMSLWLSLSILFVSVCLSVCLSLFLFVCLSACLLVDEGLTLQTSAKTILPHVWQSTYICLSMSAFLSSCVVNLFFSGHLKISGLQLPEWGFQQFEVCTDRVVHQQSTIWNVEEHQQNISYRT